ncbi:single-stranded-DNA-specific exonuclease RecJ [Thiovibrio sp. JS02]
MSSLLKKRWEVLPVDGGQAERLGAELRLPVIFAALLLQRGIADRGEAERFFSASLADLPSPFLLKGMREAVLAVASALAGQRPVVVYGDYDVDGTTGAAILSIFLKAVGFRQVFPCQPLRLEDGYGLHPRAVERKLPAEIFGQAPLLITVDCGISDHLEVGRFKEMGWSVIVTDHHQPPAQLPEMADAVINPLQPGCAFPDKNLAGVGVAFFLLMGVRSHLLAQGYFPGKGMSPNLKAYLDLVAIGTVGDMVPLTGVNRILVKAGLEQLQKCERPGINELLRVSGLKGPGVGCEDIGFRLGPRINAAGRLGDAARALALLASNDAGEARELAEELNRENEARKLLIDALFKQAAPVAEEMLARGKKGLVLLGEEWHPGVIGIGAAKIVERYHRPTLVFTRLANGLAKGSGRSVPGLNLHEILRAMGELFTHFGGHEAAIGLSLPLENLAELERRFEESLAEKMTAGMLQPRIEIAWHGKADECAGREFHAFYERLAPFGMGNPEPIFALSKTLEEARVVGVNHLKFRTKINGAIYGGIGFGLSDCLQLAESGQRLELAFRWRKNFFRGEQSWQLDVVDIRHSSD